MPHLFRTRDKKGKPRPRWRFQYTDWQGTRRTGTGCTSKTETEKLASRIQAQHDEIRKGYRKPPQASDKHERRDFTDVVEEYLKWGMAQGGRRGKPWSKDHARKRQVLLPWWHEQLGFQTLTDLAGVLPRVEKALRGLHAKGLAGKTVQEYAAALRAFVSWCVTRGYLADDPLKALVPFDTTPQAKRRAMTRDEIRRLLDAAPEHLRLLYEVTFCSGLRAGELRALTVNDLDVERGGLHLQSEWTKNRKPGFQPLPKALVERLQDFVAEGRAAAIYRDVYRRTPAKNPPPTNRLLYVPTNTARELDKDLKAAGIPKWAPGGKIDFHACRVAYITFVVEAGAGIKEAQKLARHVNPELTLNTYARARDERLSEIAERVGEGILGSENITGASQRNAAVANGCGAESYMVEAGGIEPP